MSKLPEVNLQKLQAVVYNVETSVENFHSLEDLSVAIASTVWGEENDLSGDSIAKIIVKNNIKTKPFVITKIDHAISNGEENSHDNSSNICVLCEALGNNVPVSEDAFSTSHQSVLRQIPKLKRKVFDPSRDYYLCDDCLANNPKVKEAHAKKVEETIKLKEKEKIEQEKRQSKWDASLEEYKKANLTDVQLMVVEEAFVSHNVKVGPSNIKNIMKSHWTKVVKEFGKNHPCSDKTEQELDDYYQLHKQELGLLLSNMLKSK